MSSPSVGPETLEDCLVDWMAGLVASSNLLVAFYRELQDSKQSWRAERIAPAAERWLTRLPLGRGQSVVAAHQAQIKQNLPPGDHTLEQERILWMEAVKRVGTLVVFFVIGVSLVSSDTARPGSGAVSRQNQFKDALGVALMGLRCAFPDDDVEDLLEASWVYSRDQVEVAMGAMSANDPTLGLRGPDGRMVLPALIADEAHRVLQSAVLAAAKR